MVRLENRCANFERQIKSQKSNNVPSMKAGQSPFIPGPSRQILEGLMQENSELKKTVNSLQRKGSSGYLEAVVSGLLAGKTLGEKSRRWGMVEEESIKGYYIHTLHTFPAT